MRSPTAARASILATFTAGQGYADDGDYSAVSWLIHRTGITRGAAVGHTAWAKRTGTHPRVLAALAAGQVSESVGRLICLWTGSCRRSPGTKPTSALVAAAAGWGWRNWRRCSRRCTSGPAGTCPMRTRTGTSPTAAEAGRHVRRGRAAARGPHPDCAEMVEAVLDALGGQAGEEDTGPRSSGTTTRSPGSDAAAGRRGLVPERAGQPVKAWVHISLADLLLLDGDSALQDEWTARVRERWAARAQGIRVRRGRRRLAGRGRRRGDRLRRRNGAPSSLVTST